MRESLVISGATLINGVAEHPIEGQSIWIKDGRIEAIESRDELGVLPSAEPLDAHGKYVVPGLMDANVHLLGDVCLENLIRHEDRYEDVIAEAAQIALRNGLTTVFDTWGPRRPLMEVRERINCGNVPGSRIFCAGNIIGFDGPCSPDFFEKSREVASPAVAERVNALWVENVGPALSWMTPERVMQEVRAYISKGIDFLKYASCEHAGAPLLFSPRIQALMVQEAHRAGITAQAHTLTVESLLISIEAGCDLIQHCNLTGPTIIPTTTLELIVERRTGAVVFPFTRHRLDWMREHGDTWSVRNLLDVADTNCRNLVQSGATLLLGSDAHVISQEMATDPVVKKAWIAPGEDNLAELGQNHFVWFKAMEEKGCPPMGMLRAATKNIAEAYGKDEDLGTLEAGKVADLLILNKNPLLAAANYRDIHMIIKDGVIIDRDALPLRPILTRPMESPSAEVLAYRAHASASAHGQPSC